MNSLFDIVPMHKQFKLMINSINGEKRYQELLSNIDLFFDYVKKDLQIIKEDINHYSYSNKMKQIIKERKEQMCTETQLENFVNEYEQSWINHDNFAITVGDLTKKLITKEINENKFIELGSNLMTNAIKNDVDVHVFTFSLQTILKKHEGRNIVVPFEYELNEDCLLLSEKEFAKRYTYGNVSLARKYIERCAPTNIPELIDIAEQMRSDYFLEQKGDLFKIRNKLAFWEVFEEPRRRFSSLYGIYDYFFRESLFLVGQKKGLFQGYTSALQIPQHDVLNKIRGILKNEKD